MSVTLTPSSTPTVPWADTRQLEGKLELVLRIAVAAEFIGHGAFGVFTKEGWVAYYAALGIPESGAWMLMPATGAVDIALGVTLLAWPMRGFVAWMAFWGLFTAFLRPAAGEGMWEVVERSYNYGVPLALLLLYGIGTFSQWTSPRKAIPHLFSRVREVPRLTAPRVKHFVWGFRAIVGAFLVGHGALGVFYQKPLLIEGYESIGLTSLAEGSTLAAGIGLFEIGLGVLVFAVPATPLLLFVLAWKLGTEALYWTMGAYGAGFEVMERAGSFAAPLALIYFKSIADREARGDDPSDGGNRKIAKLSMSR